MEAIVILVAVSAVILFAFFSPYFSRKILLWKIRKQLQKYRYELVSVNRTSKSFTYCEAAEGWRKFVLIKHVPALTTVFKTITIKRAGKVYTVLAAVDTFLGIFHRVTFDRELETSEFESIQEST